MTKLNFAASTLAATVLTACGAFAQSTARIGDKPSNTCFVRSDVQNFSAVNDHTVYLRVGVDQFYRLDLMSDCVNLTSAQHLALEDQPASVAICSPLQATVIVWDSPGFPQHCPVIKIHHLTPDEVTALGKNKP